jgi:hypothetical protein
MVALAVFESPGVIGGRVAPNDFRGRIETKNFKVFFGFMPSVGLDTA